LRLPPFDTKLQCPPEWERMLADKDQMKVDLTRERWEIFFQYYLARACYESFVIGDKLGCSTTTEFVVRTTGSLPQERKRIIKPQDSELLKLWQAAEFKKGTYRICRQTRYASNIHMVRKGKKFRACGDYRTATP
jgi:hypothetical protein